MVCPLRRVCLSTRAKAGNGEAESAEERAARSRIMSAIRARDTSCEMLLRRVLWRSGLRGYRTRSSVSGHPDVVYLSRRVAVFVDDCFWHRCPECYRPAKRRSDFWEPKIARNVERDREVTEELVGAGWTVLRFWEHSVRRNVGACVKAVAAAIGREVSGS